MFKIKTIEGQNCPILICDICGEQLTDAGLSAVVFDNFAQNDSIIDVLHVHKDVNGKSCHSEAESLIRARGAAPGWQEMKRCLADLVSNTGIPPDELAKYDDSPFTK